jgi:autotransporter-associated beta strand protein
LIALRTLLASSALAACLVGSNAASAQCAPDPSTEGGSVTCSGDDPDGLTVQTNANTVTVLKGATVSSMTVDIGNAVNQSVPGPDSVTIIDNGQIQAGLIVHSGTPTPGALFGPRMVAGLTVGSTGSTSIALVADPGATSQGYAAINIDNSGHIQASSGPAITTNDPVNAGVLSLINRPGGYIGSIQAPVVTLDNQGTIDGGQDSAIRFNLNGQGLRFSPATLGNSGTITASGSAATIDLTTPDGISNSGLITNAGTGSAIATTAFTGIVNAAGGTIDATANVAIRSTAALSVQNAGTITGDSAAITTTSSLSLVNTGTINGSVRADGVDQRSSNIDLTGGGRINGSLTLGAGDDSVIVDFVPAQPPLGAVTGTVDGGAGIDTLVYKLPGSVAIDTGLPLPTSFERLGLALQGGSTATLTPGFTTSVGLAISATAASSAPATLVNQSNFAVTGPAITLDNSFLSPINFINTGSIAASLSTDDSAITIVSPDHLTNSGSVTATGGRAVVAGLGTVDNSGTITTDGNIGIAGAGADSIGSVLTVTNSGMINQASGASDGIGVSGAASLTNSGTISTGGSAVLIDFGQRSASSVINSGTISSADDVAIRATTSTDHGFNTATILNQDGGVIAGGAGAAAIELSTAVVDNAGRIDGDVLLGTNNSTPAASSYVSRGGSLNGNLTFGAANDTVLLFGNATGISGTVDGGGGTNTFAHVFTATATVDVGSLPVLLNFQGVGIGAGGSSTALIVTGPTSGIASPLGFFGDGTIVNQANVLAGAQAGANQVTLGAYNSLAGISGALDFVNQATLADGVSGTARAFSNNGTISSTVPSGGALSLAIPASGSFMFDNTGLISNPGQPGAVDAVNAVGIGISANPSGAQLASLTNSGTIAGGLSIEAPIDRIDITNSGAITATRGATYQPAVPTDSRFYSSDLKVSTALAVRDAGSADSVISITNASGATISATGGTTLQSGMTGTIPTQYREAGSVGIVADGQTVSVVNAGTIIGGPDIPLTPDSPVTFAVGTIPSGAQIAGGVQIYAAKASVTNTGTIIGSLGIVASQSSVINSGAINGSVYLTGGPAKFVDSGTIGGGIQFGAGDDSLTLVTGARVAGPMDGGVGADTLVLDGVGDATLDSAQVVGFETLTKQGSGGWTLGGMAAASPSAVSVQAGTLNLSGNALADTASVSVDAGGTLGLRDNEAIDELSGTGNVALGTSMLTVGAGNGSSSFAGALSGDGGLVKTGSGSFELAGTSNYTGPTMINSGRLAVNGSIASAVTINAGGTLGGNGTVGAVTVLSGGVYAPGNSIGTSNVTGNVTFASGSVYQVEVNSAGSADRVSAGGMIAITGGTVQVLPVPGSYNPLTSYTILTAAGGITGRFDGATSSLAFLTPHLDYADNGVTLELVRNDIDFASAATTPNGAAVANAVSARDFGDPIYNAILNQTAIGADNAFSQLSGEIYADLPTVLVESDRRVRDAVLDHNHTGVQDGSNLWMQSPGTSVRSRSQAPVANVRSTEYGVIGGFDYGFGSARIGLNGGYLRNDLTVPTLASRAQINSMLTGGSVAWLPQHGRIVAQAGITHAWHHIDTTRAISTPGIAGTYRSVARANTTQIFGELAVSLSKGPIAIMPFVRHVHDWERSGAVAESGGPAALLIRRERRGNDASSFGVRFSGTRPLTKTVAIEPDLSVAYARNWGRLSSVRSEMIDGRGPAFDIVGATLGRDSLDANGGVALIFGGRLRVGITGNITRSAYWRSYGGAASVGIHF